MITAWEYLRRCRKNLTRRQEMQEAIDHLRSKAYPGAMRIKHVMVQETVPEDKTGRILSDVETKLWEYQHELALIRRQRVQAQYWIDQIKSPLFRQLLEQYYLTPVEVTEEIGGRKMTRLAPQDLSMVASTLGRTHIWAKKNHHVAVEAFAVVSGLPLDSDED